MQLQSKIPVKKTKIIACICLIVLIVVCSVLSNKEISKHKNDSSQNVSDDINIQKKTTIETSELQEKTCHQFDCAIKTVIRHRAIDFYRAIRRSEKKEMPFAEIMDDLLNSIGTEDTYSTDYVAVFEVCGEKVSIEDEQLARALKAIEERKRNIVLQYFFIGDTDTYIGKMLDCSRANVTKCRIQALDKLKQLIEEEKEKCQKS